MILMLIPEVLVMRSIWKGSISFGLVNIPVSLYAATEDKRISFNQLHKCHSPIKYQKYCPVCEREVKAEEIVKGYNYNPGQYVILADEDFASLPLKTLKTIDILDFVAISEIDPIYYQKTYYLGPTETGGKAYGLLIKAMQKTDKVGIAKIALRQKESLAVLRVGSEESLLLETIFYPAEIRPVADIPYIQVVGEASERETKLAIDLINSLSVPFNPEKYIDEYRTALLELIEKKVTGEEFVEVEKRVDPEVLDLMEALRKSIAVLDYQDETRH